MFVLVLAVFFSMSAFAMLLPPLMFVVRNLGAESEFALMVLSVYSFTAFFAGPMWGRLSDRLGRKPVLVGTYALAAVAYMGLASGVGGLWGLVASLTLAGAMSGNMAVVFAGVADHTSEDKRSRGMGFVGAAIGAAFTIGPAIGGQLSGKTAEIASLSAPASVSLVLCLLASLAILVRFKEGANHVSSSGISRLDAFRKLVKRPQLLALCLMVLMFTTGLSQMEPTLPFLLADRFEWGPQAIGQAFTFAGLVLVIVQGGMVGRITKRFGDRMTAQLGAFFTATGLVTIALTSGVVGLFVGLFVMSCGSGLFTPALASLASRQAEANERGYVMGSFYAMQAFARGLGPLLAGALFAQLNILPFLVGGGLMGLVAIWLLRYREVKTDTALETGHV